MVELRSDGEEIVDVLEDYNASARVPSRDADVYMVLDEAAKLVEPHDPELAERIVNARNSLRDPTADVSH